MDQWMRNLLFKKLKIKNCEIGILDILLLCGTTAAGILLRTTVMETTSIAHDVYMEYMLAIKVVSFILEALLAVVMSAFTWQLTKNKTKTLCCYGLVFLLPTVAANGAMFGRGDVIYLVFAMCSLLCLVKEKGHTALILYALSVVCSSYAFFLLPVYILWFFKGKIKLLYLLWIPIGYTLKQILLQTVSLPILQVLAMQKDVRKDEGFLLSYNCPNVYQFIGADKFPIEYTQAGTVFTIGLILMLCIYLMKKNYEANNRNFILLSVFFCLFVPFFMPGMDERSLLLAEMLMVLYAMMYIRRFYLAIILSIVSYAAYSAFFRGGAVMPFSFFAFVLLGIIALIGYDLMVSGKDECIR